MAGVLLIIISAASFGALAVLAPLAYRAGTNPITLLFLRFFIAGIVMSTVMMVRQIRFPTGRLLLWLALMGGVWYVLQTLAYFTALRMASPGLVALLLYLYPALVTVLSGLFLREKITKAQVLALALASVGTALTISPSGKGDFTGIALALTAALLYAGYIVASGVLLRHVEPFPATTVIMIAAGMTYGGLAAIGSFQAPRALSGWWAIIASAILSIVALGTFFAGIEKVGSANAAILSTIEPVITVVLAGLLLSERIELLQLAGGALILSAVVFLGRSKPMAKARRSD